MWDTPKNLSQLCKVLLPTSVTKKSSIAVSNAKSLKSIIISKVKCKVSKKILNKQKVDKLKVDKSDLIYIWGSIPRNSYKEFIIELDNPYSLAYYNIDNFKNNIDKIKANLRKSKKIAYMSKTCMNHSLELFGKEFEAKSFVNYPFMNNNFNKNKRDESIVNFVFVGLDFKRKGGSEILEAFNHTSESNIHLTFISNVDEHTKEKYKDDNRINILPPQSREKLLNEIYPKMDIMILASLHESFGVVLLEALSYGMGLIAVNVYATPEMVIDNYNGKLLHHPILKPTILSGDEIINCVDLKITEFNDKYLANGEFYYGLYSEIKGAIEESNLNYKIWQENSLKLFNDKFSPRVWKKNFKKIIE